MPRFMVYATTQSSGGVQVDAPTAEDAIEKVLKEGFPGFCADWGKYWYRAEDGWKVTFVENALGNTVWEAEQE